MKIICKKLFCKLFFRKTKFKICFSKFIKHFFSQNYFAKQFLELFSYLSSKTNLKMIPCLLHPPDKVTSCLLFAKKQQQHGDGRNPRWRQSGGPQTQRVMSHDHAPFI